MAQKTIVIDGSYVPTLEEFGKVDDNFDENYASIALINTGTIVYTHRQRVTTAEINAGASLLAAVTGKSYQLLDCKAISYGGAVGATTTVDILGTQSTSSVKLVAFAQAGLTQSAVLRDGDSSSAVLADGASYIACDAASAITIAKTGSDVTTATGVDVILQYTIG